MGIGNSVFLIIIVLFWFANLVLQIAPDWRQAITLKKTVEDQIAKGNNNTLLFNLIMILLRSMNFLGKLQHYELTNRIYWIYRRCYWHRDYCYCCGTCSWRDCCCSSPEEVKIIPISVLCITNVLLSSCLAVFYFRCRES